MSDDDKEENVGTSEVVESDAWSIPIPKFTPGADLIKLFWSKIYSKIQKKINPLLCG